VLRRMASFSRSPRIRSAPHRRFAAASSRIRAIVSAATFGLGADRGRDCRRQKRLNPARCQRRTVSGRPMTSAPAQARSRLARRTTSPRSAADHHAAAPDSPAHVAPLAPPDLAKGPRMTQVAGTVLRTNVWVGDRVGRGLEEHHTVDPEVARQIAQMTGAYALRGACIGAAAGLLGALVNVWNQRRLARDTELRKWRLEQLRPTLEIANSSLAHFAEIDEIYHRLMRERNQENLAAFARKLHRETNPFSNLGHSIVVARPGARVLSKPLKEFFEVYTACMESIAESVSKGVTSDLTDEPPPSLVPSESNLNQLLDAVLALNQATERYAFGRVGPPTLAEMDQTLARWRALLDRLHPLSRRPRPRDPR